MRRMIGSLTAAVAFLLLALTACSMPNPTSAGTQRPPERTGINPGGDGGGGGGGGGGGY